MKMVLDIKGKKALYPSKNDVVVYDGKNYYITTKEELFQEEHELLIATRNELERVKKENADYKKDVAAQLLQMSELIQKLYK